MYCVIVRTYMYHCIAWYMFATLIIGSTALNSSNILARVLFSQLLHGQYNMYRYYILHVHVFINNIRVLQSYKITIGLLSSVLLQVSSTSNKPTTKKNNFFRIAWYYVIMIYMYMSYKPSIFKTCDLQYLVWVLA